MMSMNFNMLQQLTELIQLQHLFHNQLLFFHRSSFFVRSSINSCCSCRNHRSNHRILFVSATTVNSILCFITGGIKTHLIYSRRGCISLFKVAAAVNSKNFQSCLRFWQQLNNRTILRPPLGKLEAAASEVIEGDGFHCILCDTLVEAYDGCRFEHGLSQQHHPDYIDEESEGSCGWLHGLTSS